MTLEFKGFKGETACGGHPRQWKKRHVVRWCVTSDLVQRTWQHKERLGGGFAAKHSVENLVWYELHATMDSVISREKQIKRWNRAWKVRLIEESNPYWIDLWSQIIG